MKKNVPTPEPIQGGPEEMDRIITFGLASHFGKDFTELPAGELHLVNALRRFYAYRHNGYVLAEALDICTKHHVNSPTWVLMGISEGFQRFNGGNVKLERALHMGKRDKEEYDQYRREQPLMAKVRERINAGDSIIAACGYVENRGGPDRETLKKQYNRMWRSFYDYVKGN